jgi:hypothetical protein
VVPGSSPGTTEVGGVVSANANFAISRHDAPEVFKIIHPIFDFGA